jgi:hypothetical protein
MDLDVLRRTVDQIVDDRLTDTVTLHVMGEPTLHRGLLEAVRYIKERGLAIQLTTTGSLLTLKKMEDLLDSGVDHILFSAQTPDAESFSLRGVRMDFERYKQRVVSCIAYALSRPSNTSITLSFLVTPLKMLMPTKKMSTINDKRALTKHFAGWLDDILAECSSSPIGRAIIDNREGVIDGLQQMRMLGWNKLDVTEHFALETRVLGDWVHDGLTCDKIWGARYGSCEGLTEHLGILWNGDMVFCCVDYEGKTTFGNVRHERIATALQKSVVQKSLDGFRNYRVEHEYCKRCLGDRTFIGSAIRQLGSVLYFKFYRPRWAKKRAQGSPVVCAETSQELLDL